MLKRSLFVHFTGIIPIFCTFLISCSWIGPEREWDNKNDLSNPDRPLPPVLVDFPNDTTAFVNDTLTFTVSCSDESGDELMYTWDIDHNNSKHYIPDTAITHSWRSDDTGHYEVSVFATNSWKMSSDTVRFTVTIIAGMPRLASTFDDTIVHQNATVTTSFAAQDSNGEITMYLWGIGEEGWSDSAEGPGPVDVSFSNQEDGKLNIHWAARDDDFLTAEDSFSIQFNQGPDTAYLYLPENNEIPFETFNVLENRGTVNLQYYASDPDSSKDTLTYRFIVTANQSDTLKNYLGKETGVTIDDMTPSTVYEWFLAAEDLFGDTISSRGTFTTASLPMAPESMVLIDSYGASFHMGQSGFDPSEEPIHVIRFDYSFWMDTTEVTNSMYAEAMNLPTPNEHDGHYPVSGISWYEAVLYCNAKSTIDGRDTVYSYSDNDNGVLSGISVDFTANGYRLPTEAEWEYACKKDTLTLYHWGNDAFDAPVNAWFVDNGSETSHPVASLRPNRFGLYDMAGNVWEWCNDWFGGDYYTSTPPLNPPGPENGTYKIIRGGSYSHSLYFLQAGTRGRMTPATKDPTIGFRTVVATYRQP